MVLYNNPGPFGPLQQSRALWSYTAVQGPLVLYSNPGPFGPIQQSRALWCYPAIQGLLVLYSNPEPFPPLALYTEQYLSLLPPSPLHPLHRMTIYAICLVVVALQHLHAGGFYMVYSIPCTIPPPPLPPFSPWLRFAVPHVLNWRICRNSFPARKFIIVN